MEFLVMEFLVTIFNRKIICSLIIVIWFEKEFLKIIIRLIVFIFLVYGGFLRYIL